jgi:microcystin-dependent protein
MAQQRSVVNVQPAGMVSMFGNSTVPTGWLQCNGAAVSRTTYSDLFANIGTTFGVGDGSTTFNLPELRGEFIRGWDNSRGVDSGRTFGSLQYATGMDEQALQDAALRLDNTDSAAYNVRGVSGVPGDNNTGRTYSMYKIRPRNVAFMVCIKY